MWLISGFKFEGTVVTVGAGKQYATVQEAYLATYQDDAVLYLISAGTYSLNFDWSGNVNPKYFKGVDSRETVILQCYPPGYPDNTRSFHTETELIFEDVYFNPGTTLNEGSYAFTASYTFSKCKMNYDGSWNFDNNGAYQVYFINCDGRNSESITNGYFAAGANEYWNAEFCLVRENDDSFTSWTWGAVETSTEETKTICGLPLTTDMENTVNPSYPLASVYGCEIADGALRLTSAWSLEDEILSCGGFGLVILGTNFDVRDFEYSCQFKYIVPEYDLSADSMICLITDIVDGAFAVCIAYDEEYSTMRFVVHNDVERILSLPLSDLIADDFNDLVVNSYAGTITVSLNGEEILEMFGRNYQYQAFAIVSQVYKEGTEIPATLEAYIKNISIDAIGYGPDSGVEIIKEVSGIQRYWVNNSGNFSDPDHWAWESGGASGADVPDETTEVIIDGKSFDRAGHYIDFSPYSGGGGET